jgi:hypothetical protein
MWPNKDLSKLTSLGFPRAAAKNALKYTDNRIDDARDLLVHQSHIRGWDREAALHNIRKDAIKTTRIGIVNCSICSSLKVLRDAGGMRPDNAAYKLYASQHAVLTTPPPGTDGLGPTGKGWIAIPSSSGTGFYVVDPEMVPPVLDQKNPEGDGGERGHLRWGDGEHIPRYFEGSTRGITSVGLVI